ncbi:MAG: hypothetical protein BroJett011_64040 [Chloroflexota bacterium]|nr:MAG: hypothetical protein BroJett011_64040 [Chloroflexota bacterium]
MNGSREEIKDGAVLVEDNQIRWLGPSLEVEQFIAETWPELAHDGFDKILDTSGGVVIPA